MKTYKVGFTPEARKELDGIAELIGEEAGAATARRWSVRLREQAASLRNLPHRGASGPEWGQLRRLVVAPYLIVYRVEEPDRVKVLRVLDGRRDLSKLLLDWPAANR